jgi:hypothetical protein
MDNFSFNPIRLPDAEKVNLPPGLYGAGSRICPPEQR